jgi:hypothetical protein
VVDGQAPAWTGSSAETTDPLVPGPVRFPLQSPFLHFPFPKTTSDSYSLWARHRRAMFATVGSPPIPYGSRWWNSR